MFFSSKALDSFDQYLQDVEKYPLIEDAETERRIARRARTGDRESAERLVTANLRFVISYVKKYQGRGLNLAELVGIGNEGQGRCLVWCAYDSWRIAFSLRQRRHRVLR